MKNKTITVLLIFAFAVSGMLIGCKHDGTVKPVKQSAETETCLQCHESNTPGIVGQWKTSHHYREAVGCYECHQADSGDSDAFNHNGQNISIIVSPLDCAGCHPDEQEQFDGSHHAEAGEILDSLDNVLAEIVEGDMTFNGESPVVVSGCAACHGSRVLILDNGTMDPATFPNTGIGRLNPDGSKGACSACHNRHEFSKAQARRPGNCGRCHLGPDHPQAEIYAESQHGILFDANEDELNLDDEDWVVGVDYTAAPTCATCHMSATPTQQVNHDIATRNSWNLRAAISSYTDDWETKRDNMKDVCQQCHSYNHVDNFYIQLDAGVHLYNNKFGLPGKEIHDAIRSAGIISNTVNFDDKLEWYYWELWHHEGRRARSGLAMMGPDYVQWHGFYDIAENFYFELVPEAIELCEAEIAEGSDLADEAQTILDRIEVIMDADEHDWFDLDI
jgi:hypothetical protein